MYKVNTSIVCILYIIFVLYTVYSVYIVYNLYSYHDRGRNVNSAISYGSGLETRTIGAKLHPIMSPLCPHCVPFMSPLCC